MNITVNKVAKLKLVELAEHNYHVFLTVKTNGKRNIFILDTGASGSVVDLNYYTKNLDAKHKTINQEVRGLHSTQSQTHVGKLKTLEIGTLQFKNLQVSCIDLSHVNQAYKMRNLKMKVNGIIGSDLLVKIGAIIDYNTMEMFVRS